MGNEKNSVLSFYPMNSADFSLYAQDLFAILWFNMNEIEPSGYTFEEDFAVWFDYNKNDTERKTILFIDEAIDRIVGYFQYRLTDNTLGLDDIQILPDYQGKGLVYRPLMKYFLPKLPAEITKHQSYINKNNLRSAAILEKMGAKIVGETPSGKSLCYEGSITDLKNWTNLK